MQPLALLLHFPEGRLTLGRRYLDHSDARGSWTLADLEAEIGVLQPGKAPWNHTAMDVRLVKKPRKRKGGAIAKTGPKRQR